MHAFLFGKFNCTNTPPAPLGTKIIANVKADNRHSWDPRGEPGRYTGTALEHYRCVTCYFPRTRAQCVVDTVQFPPHSINFSEGTIQDFLKQAATDLIKILNIHRRLHIQLSVLVIPYTMLSLNLLLYSTALLL